jgi:hypothetical protein
VGTLSRCGDLWSGQNIDLSSVTILAQRGGGYLGDVGGVDRRQADVAERGDDRPASTDRVRPGEQVGVEAAGAQDCPVQSRPDCRTASSVDRMSTPWECDSGRVPTPWEESNTTLVTPADLARSRT